MADSCDVWQKTTKFCKAIILQLKNKQSGKKNPHCLLNQNKYNLGCKTILAWDSELLTVPQIDDVAQMIVLIINVCCKQLPFSWIMTILYSNSTFLHCDLG